MTESTGSSLNASPIVTHRQNYATNFSQKSSPSNRLSPIAPLAPLEYLQNQRRGSITDPSLHAASHTSVTKPSSLRQEHSSSPSSSAHNGLNPKSGLSDPRPNSPYVFGDATPHTSETTSPHLRNLLRSPSPDSISHRPSPTLSSDSQDTLRTKQSIQGSSSSRDSTHKPPFDTDRNGYARHNIRDSISFDYNMRRHSIATGQHPHPHTVLPPLSHGIKRKMSVDRSIFPPVGEETDSQLVGPGVPSVMEVDTEPPAPKRRGSAFDTQRIAQLSLNDRRGSTDSRHWWTNERRDSTSSILSNLSSAGGYSSGFTSGDSPHSRPPTSIATFSWTGNSHQNDASGTIQNEAESHVQQTLSRPFDLTTPTTSNIPPLNYLPDRRMSVPDTLISPPSGPIKPLRSRSRPPSRQGQNAESAPQSNSSQDGSNSVGPSSGKKEAGSTPYSRSPELRVSHKLAERKRRKEMKDLFDELRDQLPADRGMKASKWEILTKAIDYVHQLKQQTQDMAREIESLRHELDISRGGSGPLPPFQGGGPPPPPHVAYGQVPMVPSQGPPSLLQPPLPGPSHLPLPRSASNQSPYSSLANPPPPPLSLPNGGLHHRPELSPP